MPACHVVFGVMPEISEKNFIYYTIVEITNRQHSDEVGISIYTTDDFIYNYVKHVRHMINELIQSNKLNGFLNGSYIKSYNFFMNYFSHFLEPF